jgi:hypothetical protein
VEKPEGKRPLRKPRRRWVGNSKLMLEREREREREIEFVLIWTGLIWLRIGTSGGLL